MFETCSVFPKIWCVLKPVLKQFRCSAVRKVFTGKTKEPELRGEERRGKKTQRESKRKRTDGLVFLHVVFFPSHAQPRRGLNVYR